MCRSRLGSGRGWHVWPPCAFPARVTGSFGQTTTCSARSSFVAILVLKILE